MLDAPSIPGLGEHLRRGFAARLDLEASALLKARVERIRGIDGRSIERARALRATPERARALRATPERARAPIEPARKPCSELAIDRRSVP